MFSIPALVIATGIAGVSQPNIVDRAIETEQLSTLVTALKAAGLAEGLSADGPVTVFAPTNEAFERINDEALAYLLSKQGSGQLARILLHHVVPGEVDSTTLADKASLTTLAGTSLSIEITGGRLLVDNSVVDVADVKASNGIVHMIDRVLLPPVEPGPMEQLLVNAIERGVPLFNNNNPQGCAAVYVTALEALVAVEGFGLDEEVRVMVSRQLERIDTQADPTERAWAYRRIMDALLNGTMTEPVKEPTEGRVLFDFNEPAEVRAFNVVLDGVMGGLSTGRVSSGTGTLIFDGETSLRNNGGFSSMRAGLPEGSCEGADSLRVRFKGDGRTWIIGTRRARNSGADSYWTRFDTVEGEWMEVLVPIEEMVRTSFGQPLRGRITPSQVRGIEFYIYDKKAGPFRLEIDSIEAVRTDRTSA